MSRKYLLYISQNYSFEILRPLQTEIIKRGQQCCWYVEGNKVNLNNFLESENRLFTIDEVKDYSPDAVLVPGNHVPNFIPGLKVQVFHGLEWKKKGHFRIRGFFDLYCTHGELTTKRFRELEKKYQYFKVIETGWPKLDPLYQTKAFELKTDLPVILFAPTFSPNLTCAVKLLEQIRRIVATNQFHWLVKFHPKMNQEWMKPFQEIENKNFTIVDTDNCLPLLKRADILLSDTSSIISEFLLLDKPAVTFRNRLPGEYLINFSDPEHLESSLNLALSKSEKLLDTIKIENQKLHPYRDGQSASRVLDAIDMQLKLDIPIKKPLNLWRNLKLRKKLKYWK